MNRILLRNILSNYSGLAIAGTANFLLVPLLLGRLGNEVYGILSLCFSAFVLLQMLEFGIGRAAVRYVAAWRAAGDSEKLCNLYRTGLWLFAGLGAMAAILLVVLSFRLPHWFGVSGHHVPEARTALQWTAAGLFWAFPGMMLKSYLEGAQRFDLSNTVEAVTLLIYAGLAAGLVIGGHGIVSVTIAFAVSHLTGLILLLVFFHRVFPEIQSRGASFHSSLLRELREFSFWNFLRDVASRISWDLDTFIIAFFLSANAVTPYVLGRKLPYIYSSISWRWVTVFFPHAAALDAEGKQEELKMLYLRATRWCVAISMVGALLLTFLARPVLVLWLGEVNDETVLVQQIVTFSLLIDLTHAVSATILTGTGRVKRITQYFLLEAALNLIMSVMLVRTLGIIGVALATAISSVVTVLFLQIPYGCLIIGTSLSTYLREVWKPQVIPSALTICVLWFFHGAEPMLSIGTGMVAAAVYAASFWLSIMR